MPTGTPARTTPEQSIQDQLDNISNLPQALQGGSKCSVCAHPDRLQIEALLVAGNATIRAIANKFNLKPTAIHRHKQIHVPMQLAAADAVTRQAVGNALSQVAIAAAKERLRRLDDLAKRTDSVVAARSAAGSPEVPGSASGLLAVKRTQGKYGETIEAKFDKPLIDAVIKMHEAAVHETGNWAAYVGRPEAASMQDGSTPGVVVVPGIHIEVNQFAGPAEISHRIVDAHRKPAALRLPKASEMDLEGILDPAIGGEDVREEALSNVPGSSSAGGADEDDELDGLE